MCSRDSIRLHVIDRSWRPFRAAANLVNRATDALTQRAMARQMPRRHLKCVHATAPMRTRFRLWDVRVRHKSLFRALQPRVTRAGPDFTSTGRLCGVLAEQSRPPTSNNDRESHMEKSMRLLAFGSQTSKHRQAMSLIRALSHCTCDSRPLHPRNIQSEDPSHRGKLPKGPLYTVGCPYGRDVQVMPDRTCGEDREVALSVLVRLHAMRSLLHPALRARLKHHRVASHPQVYSYYSIVHSVNIVQSLHRLQTLYAILLGLHELYSTAVYSSCLRARASHLQPVYTQSRLEIPCAYSDRVLESGPCKSRGGELGGLSESRLNTITCITCSECHPRVQLFVHLGHGASETTSSIATFFSASSASLHLSGS